MKREIETAIKDACQDLFGLEIDVALHRSGEQFGDYATNLALQIAGRLHQNPKDIAEQLITKLQVLLGDKVTAMTVVEPGFLNIQVSDARLLDSLSHLDLELPYKDKKVVIETNNPNPFKDMHIGHAFNSIVADTIANLLESGGAETHRVSYHGDVGLHVGKSMWSILKFINGDMEKLNSIAEEDRPQFLSERYAEGSAAYESDDLAKQEITLYAKASFQLDDPLYKQVYDICKQWSFNYFKQMFSRLGSQPVERQYLESEADISGRSVVEQNIGEIFERSDGAIIFPGERYGLHTRVFISAKGTTLYETRDLGLMQLKQNDFNPQSSYIVTAVEQREYFQVVLKAAELSLPQLSGITHNISTGTVKLSTGKMSSRQGNAINIGWLFEQIQEALKQRGAPHEKLSEEMVGALRYSMLKNRIGSDVVFDVNEAISLEGNSGPYLQYAHVRAHSILQKSSVSPSEHIIRFEPGERSLAYKISEYPEVTEKAFVGLMPHIICNYLYELAQVFNRFYEHDRVLGSEREAQRLFLVELYSRILSQGLAILGIPAPLQM